ncbi:MAG: hypothetical protein ACKOET_13700 [Verrucomicrobiota bacterium]
MTLPFPARLALGFLGALTASALLNGCRDSNSHSHSHSATGHRHDDHAPPHGGTPILVADDQYHLELVVDPTAAKAQVYVLDGHLEEYLAVAETNFLLVARIDGKAEQLAFQRAPDPTSGRLPEKSSLFEAGGEWLKAAKSFEGTIPTLTLNGKTFTNLSFPFPKGTKHVH